MSISLQLFCQNSFDRVVFSYALDKIDHGLFLRTLNNILSTVNQASQCYFDCLTDLTRYIVSLTNTFAKY